jgi:hypothetical protein
MKTFIYLILAIMGLTGSITGTIKLSSLGIHAIDLGQSFFVTLISMGLFVFFGYAFYHHIKDLK